MHLRALRQHGRKLLAGSPLNLEHETRALEADVLIAHALEVSTEQIAIHLNRQIAEAEQERCEQLLNRRVAGEPVAYILGSREFYGRVFEVSPAVLIPRPETELLADRSLSLLKEDLRSEQNDIQLLDVGTGSGCIVISIAAELEKTQEDHLIRYVGLDISAAALEVAGRNAVRQQVAERIEFREADLLDEQVLPIAKHSIEIVVSNPPYVAEGDELPYDVEQFEPRTALRSGVQGLDHIERLVEQWAKRFSRVLLLEIGDGQDHELECLLTQLGLRKFVFLKDLRGIRRVVEVWNERA